MIRGNLFFFCWILSLSGRWVFSRAVCNCTVVKQISNQSMRLALSSFSCCDWTMLKLSWWGSMFMVTSHATQTCRSCPHIMPFYPNKLRSLNNNCSSLMNIHVVVTVGVDLPPLVFKLPDLPSSLCLRNSWQGRTQEKLKAWAELQSEYSLVSLSCLPFNPKIDLT